jgi:quinol-cytochrome oxidoreductase complex cytochrome b subunit
MVEWLDSRIGFVKTPLKPAPEYVLHPLYWLGAFTAVSFVMQGLTGLFILLYYVPLPDQAYSSTIYIFQHVPLGRLIETFHLYNAYAMILLAFTHLMRNYFANVHKRPRELMWVAGVLLGAITLGFGLTGYLLPWTVVSKSATDVVIGMVGLLPSQLGHIAGFFISGSGSSEAMLRRFLTIHTVVLPAALIVALGFKLYMFEVHGAAYIPAYVKGHAKLLPWFPRIFLYATMIGLVFVSLLLAVSAVFPLVLPPQFTAEAASSIVVQPDWYFLWLYQILKFSAFEGSGIYYAIGIVTVIALALLLMPFYDKGKQRNPQARPVFTTIGAILIAELLVLTLWGYTTPGEVIPSLLAVIVLGGVAALVSALSYLLFRRKRRLQAKPSPTTISSKTNMNARKQAIMVTVFIPLLGLSVVTTASLLNMFSKWWLDESVTVPITKFFASFFSSANWLMTKLVEAKGAMRPYGY